jgi:Zn-dependent M28 family amino/carboxypeptidase
VELKPFRAQVHNVAAVVPGAGKLAEEVVVIGAHYDHLGYRERSSRSGKRVTCPGADDNASGVAGVLMLAKRFSDRAAGRAGRAPPAERRTLVFVAFTGEEAGFCGSGYFARHVEQLGLTGAKVVAMLNLDMIGRLKPGGLRVQGVGSGDRWREIVAAASKQADLPVIARVSALTGSDHVSFYTRKVPVLHVNTGYNRDMHSPRDTPDKINAAGAVRVVEFVEAALEQLWTDPEPPVYAGAGLMPKLFGSARAYLGIQAEESDGCLVTQVLDGTPAAKAGLKAGDVVTAWNGQPVQSLSELLAKLWAAKPGQEVKLTFRRDGKLMEATVKLGRR